MMEERIRQIKDLISPIFDQMQVYLVDIELRGNPNNLVLSVFADTEAGITMHQITDLTREIGDVLDMEDPFPGRYRLEVSSPGLDRPLKEHWQYRKNIGRPLHVLCETDEGREDLIGVLDEVNERGIVLQMKENQLEIPFSGIVKALVKTKW